MKEEDYIEKLIVANNHDPDAQHYFPIMDAYCERAERAGIRLVMEFMRYSQTESLPKALHSCA